MWSQSNNTFDQVRGLLLAIRNLGSVEFKLTMDAYAKYWNRGRVLEFTDEEVAAIPKEMYVSILSREVDHLWSRLPIEYRKDLRKYRRCMKHYNIGTDHVDGPPPMRKECVECMREIKL